MAQLERDKGALKRAEEQVNVLRKAQGQLKWEKEILEEKFSQLEADRDVIYRKFISAISQVQQRSTFKNMLFERQVRALGENLEKREAQLNEVGQMQDFL